MTTKTDHLLLDNQLCFALYATSRQVTRLYQPLLEPLGLTYPQYIVLLILWEDAPCSVSHIGKRAQLATNTLTPLLKRLELLGFLERQRTDQDERVVNIVLTAKGKALRSKCACIPEQLFHRAGYPLQDAIQLKRQLDHFLQHLQAVAGQSAVGASLLANDPAENRSPASRLLQDR